MTKELTFKSIILQVLGYYFLYHSLILFSNLNNIEIYNAVITGGKSINQIINNLKNISSKSLGLMISDFMFWISIIPKIGVFVIFIILLYFHLRNKKNWITPILAFIIFICLYFYCNLYLWNYLKMVYLEPFNNISNSVLRIVITGGILLISSFFLFIWNKKIVFKKL